MPCFVLTLRRRSVAPEAKCTCLNFRRGGVRGLPSLIYESETRRLKPSVGSPCVKRGQMPQKSATSSHRPITRLILFTASLLLMAACLIAQQPPPAEQPAEQPYVGQFLVYTGYMYLDSPKISLAEPGIHVQAGMRWSRHISVGFDYSRGTGNTAIGLNQATTALQNRFGPIVSGLIAIGQLPANYVAALPFSSVTQTFTAGPEFPYRRFKRFTPY